jgi:hypothetical protein
MTRLRQMNRRQQGLAALLAATLIAVAWASRLDEQADETVIALPLRGDAPVPRPRNTVPPTAQASPDAPPSSALSRLPWREPAADELLAWGHTAAAAPPLATPVAPAPPMGPDRPLAPPFPYQLFGRLEEDGKSRAMLRAGPGVLVVSEGELIDAQWRVQSIAADGLALIWLPARQPLHIPFKAR